MGFHKGLTKKYNFADSIRNIILEEGHVDNSLTIKDIELIAAKCYSRENYLIKREMTDMNKKDIFAFFKSKQLRDFTEKELDNLAYAVKYNFTEDFVVDYLEFLVDTEYFPNKTYFGTPINTSIVLGFIDRFKENQLVFRFGIDLKIKEKTESSPAEELAPKELFDTWIKSRAKDVVFHLTKDNVLYLVPKDKFKLDGENELIDVDNIKFTDVVEGYLTELKFEKVNNFTYKCNDIIDYFQLYWELINRGLETNYLFSKWVMQKYENYK